MRIVSIARTPRPSTGLALLAAVLLSGCALSGPLVSRVEIAETYEPTEAGFLGGPDATLPTVVWNGPGAAAEAEWLALFTRYRAGAPLTFTAAPVAEAVQARHRVMILFAPPKGLADGGLCRMTAPPTPAPEPQPAEQGVPWRVAYCVDDRTRSEAAGLLAPGATGAAPDVFAAMVPELALRLFPIVNPHRRGERCVPPGC